MRIVKTAVALKEQACCGYYPNLCEGLFLIARALNRTAHIVFAVYCGVQLKCFSSHDFIQQSSLRACPHPHRPYGMHSDGSFLFDAACADSA